MESLERYRSMQTNDDSYESDDDEESSSNKMNSVVYKGTANYNSGTMIEYGTIVENNDDNKLNTIIIKDEKVDSSTMKVVEGENKEEPEFMKYVREVEGIPEPTPVVIKPPEAVVVTPKPEIPQELRGMSVEYIEKTLKRLTVDMEAEIEVIRSKYAERIKLFENTLKVLKVLERKKN